MSKIHVTGIGLITSLGDSVSLNRKALGAGRHAISHLEIFPTRYADIRYFGEVKMTDHELRSKLNVKQAGVSRTSLLALKAMKEALEHSDLKSNEIASDRTALIVGGTVGGMCHTNEFMHDSVADSNPSEYISAYGAASTTNYLQEHFGIKGVTNTINTACSSAANAIAMGAQLINGGMADRAVVGGADSIAKFTINGFNSLHILSPEICQPFDANRQGLNLGEGAAFLVLEKEEVAKDKNIFAELSGWANANDAYHPSSISDEGEGPYQAMQGALKQAGLGPKDISYINAHGTATENNDLTESRAMLRLFEEVPPFSSTKSFVGHTLGAAGAVEAVISILSLQYQELYPNLHFEKTIPETGLRPITEFQLSSVEHVLSNSFGFGGNCSSLIFSKT